MSWTLIYPDFDHCIWKSFVVYFIENETNPRFSQNLSSNRHELFVDATPK